MVQLEVNPLLVGIVLALVIGHFRNINSNNNNSVQQQQQQQQQQQEEEFRQGEEWQPRPLPTRTSHTMTLRERQEISSTLQVTSSYLHDDDALLQKLNNYTLWKDCFLSGFQWIDQTTTTTPSSVWEELAIRIWSSHPISQGAAGYEYWCNILSPQVPLPWHVDKDETLLQNTDELSTPTMGAVYYGYPHVHDGGYLELYRGDMRSTDPSTARGEIERIRAEYDRLVLLNVSEWHRVSPVLRGERITFAVNVWHTKPESFF